MVRGLQAIDRRTAAGRALVTFRSELLQDLGGEAAVSAQKRAIVDLAVRTRLYVDSIDAWIVAQPTLINARRRALLPVLRERQALADSLARLLGQLGLERRQKPIPAPWEIDDDEPEPVPEPPIVPQAAAATETSIEPTETSIPDPAPALEPTS